MILRSNAFKDCPNCPEMVVIPAGEYLMGSPPWEAGRFANEGPQHKVTIAYPFAVGIFPVTVAEFAYFVIDTGHEAKNACHHWTGRSWILNRNYTWKSPGFVQTPSHPVVCVTWNDAKAYVDWLSQKTGKTYRLLSEAEWEYAARGGTTTARPWGEKLSRDLVNYGSDICCQPCSQGREGWTYTTPVGSFPANSFGLYDMIGNVWEWVEDCWNQNYSGAPTDGSSWQNGNCNGRVIRGASWFSDPRRVRSAVRFAFGVNINRTKVGFRVARTL